MKQFLFIISILLIFNAFATENDQLTANLLKGNQKLTQKILTHYADSKGKNENILISSKNISDALALLIVGAGKGSDTYDQLADILGIGDNNLDESLAALSSLNNRLMVERKKSRYRATPTRIKLATSLWANNNDEVNFLFSKDYIKRTGQYLNSEVDSLDFAENATVKRINKWVSDKTDEMIDKLFDYISPKMKSILISTLFIEGAWKNEFPKWRTKKGKFNLIDGTQKDIKLMERTVKSPYLEGELDQIAYQYTALRTKDRRARFEIYLPKNIDNTTDFRTGFLKNNIVLPKVAKRDLFRYVNLHLPRFKVKFKENKMRKILSPIIPNSFKDADFSLMSEEDVAVSQIIHETVLEVQEEGFRAAAATALGLECYTPPPTNIVTMKVDRPFGIRIIVKEKEHEVELFKGWIANPSKY